MNSSRQVPLETRLCTPRIMQQSTPSLPMCRNGNSLSTYIYTKELWDHIGSRDAGYDVKERILGECIYTQIKPGERDGLPELLEVVGINGKDGSMPSPKGCTGALLISSGVYLSTEEWDCAVIGEGNVPLLFQRGRGSKSSAARAAFSSGNNSDVILFSGMPRNSRFSSRLWYFDFGSFKVRA